MLERNEFGSGSDAARQRLPDCIDIKEAVYMRMAPAAALDTLSISEPINEEFELALFRRFFPSIREEAVFWYRAGKGRGMILWTDSSMQFVPNARFDEMLHAASAETRAAASEAADVYDPLREALLAIVLGEFEAVASLAPEDTALHSIQKLGRCRRA
jgi:hypothetical protein